MKFDYDMPAELFMMAKRKGNRTQASSEDPKAKSAGLVPFSEVR
jgi:hypothetical protein